MSQFPPRHRMLPGTTEPQPVPMRPADYADSGETMSFRQALTVVRRRALLILLMTAVGAGIGLWLAWDMPPAYTASAMLRMAGERQTLTGDNEETPGLTRTADPLMSIIQLIRSRTVGADVVDSLGLQLYSQTEEFSIGDLEHIKVDPRAASDSVVLTFGDKDVNARRGDRAVTARYGQPINLGVVQFTVTARPALETATLGINSREAAIDGLVSGLGATRREETDVIDVTYKSEDPRVAQRIVNTSVQAFQSLSVQWARERSRRRSEFLAEQLAQTDSMLARAQADLSGFRSRQQLASSESKMNATQTAILQLDAQVAQLQADRETFGSLQQQLKSTDEGDPRSGAPGPGDLARHRGESDRHGSLQQPAQVPAAARLDDHRALAQLAEQPRPGAAQGSPRATRGSWSRRWAARSRRSMPGSGPSAASGIAPEPRSRSSRPWPRRRCGSIAG